MKKALAVMIALLLLCTGCSKTGGQDASSDAGLGTSGTAQNAALGASADEETILMDEQGIKITLASLKKDNPMGPELLVEIENSNSFSITVYAIDVLVNGKSIDANMVSIVPAETAMEDTIGFMASDLEAAGIQSIDKIDLKFQAVENTNFNIIYLSDVISFFVPK